MLFPENSVQISVAVGSRIQHPKPIFLDFWTLEAEFTNGSIGSRFFKKLAKKKFFLTTFAKLIYI